MKKFDTIDELAQFHAESVFNANPESKGVSGLIHTACVYGANEAWRELKILNFGQAIQALEAGEIVKRYGWSNPHMVIIKQVPSHITGDIVPKMTSLPNKAKLAIMLGTKFIDYHDQCLCYDVVTGIANSWFPTISDVFAKDWCVIEMP